jgi:hypothetical protein
MHLRIVSFMIMEFFPLPSTSIVWRSPPETLTPPYLQCLCCLSRPQKSSEANSPATSQYSLEVGHCQCRWNCQVHLTLNHIRRGRYVIQATKKDCHMERNMSPSTWLVFSPVNSLLVLFSSHHLLHSQTPYPSSLLVILWPAKFRRNVTSFKTPGSVFSWK